MILGSETWKLTRHQKNKLLATEIGFWWITAKKSRKKKIRNLEIRKIMNVQEALFKYE